MSREGYGTIFGMLVFTAAVSAGALVTGHLYLKILTILGAVLTVFVVYFFRDPEREVPEGANNIISPADGKVIDIKEEFENEYLKTKATRVSIFMSVFDVHVNRIPMAGTIEYLRYQKGSFVQAYKSEASSVNEQSIIGIENNGQKLLFKQIAGILARRIVCNVRAGNEVKLGERFGVIKFGSRVDIFIPENVEIKVSLNQKVKGGESILGEIANDS